MFKKKNAVNNNVPYTSDSFPAKAKKKFYQKWWFWAIIAVLALGGIIGGDSSDDPNNTAVETSAQSEQTDTVETEAADSEAAETEKKDSDAKDTDAEKADSEEPVTEEEELTPEENARQMGQWWFTNIDWDSVFKYKNKVHYIAGYYCQPVTAEELQEYGDYVGIAPADLQNGFGAEFSSNIYIFMDENGVAQHVFYDEADGSTVEIPMDNIIMEY